MNPAVTFSTLLAGFYPLLHSLIYIALQICGAMVGALLVVGLMPKTYIGMGDGAPGELQDALTTRQAECCRPVPH